MRYTFREFFRDREKYADRVFVSEDTFAVADGMGSLEGSKLSAETAVKLVEKKRPFRSIDEIESFFEFANKEIMKEVAKLGDGTYSGTTLSLLSINCDSFIIGHVGDSRIYLIREGNIKKLTEDQIVFKNGKKYIQALGIDWKINVFLLEDKVLEGDTFLIVSDGIRGVLDEEEIKDSFDEDIEKFADRILSAYMEKLPEDDLSLIIVRV